MPNERILAGQIVSNRMNAGDRERDRQKTVGENFSIFWQRFVRGVYSLLSLAFLCSRASFSCFTISGWNNWAHRIVSRDTGRMNIRPGAEAYEKEAREKPRRTVLSLGTRRLFHRVSTYASILLPWLSCRRWIHAEARLFIDSWIERKLAGKLRNG